MLKHRIFKEKPENFNNKFGSGTRTAIPGTRNSTTQYYILAQSIVYFNYQKCNISIRLLNVFEFILTMSRILNTL